MTRPNPRSEVRHSASEPTDSPDLQTDFSYIKNKPENADKVFRLVNDEKGRVAKFIRQGWEPVQEEESDQVLGSFLDARSDSKQPSKSSKNVPSYVYVHVGQINTTSDGRAVLMMIDKEKFKKIQSQRMAKIEASEQALDPRTVNGNGVETYAPNLPTGGTGLKH